MTDPSPLLSVRDLSVAFPGPDGPRPAVRSVSLDVWPGRTLAIVGESGSGKSVTARAIMRLTDYSAAEITGGAIRFRRRDGGELDLRTAPADTLRRIRGDEIAMIFQDAMTSLNPVAPIGAQIVEAIRLHQGGGRDAARARARDILDKVRVADAEAVLDRYPHQLSGGMRQRVMIAMALSCQPSLLIADEPTTALDVTIQAQILNTIRELQREFGTAVIFITHDMGVVAEMADDVMVMRRGEKLEDGPVRRIFAAPAHPYTQALLAAVPRLGSRRGQKPPDTVDRTRTLCEVVDLTARFDARRGRFGRLTHRVHAVEGVSLEIHPGETLALVGESGSGKTTIGRMIQQLTEPSGGAIRFHGRDLRAMSPAERRRLLQKVQYIFQDPYAALDPRRTVGASIAEPITTHRLLTGRAAIAARVGDLLEQVGLARDHAARLPHEFSGGQRQRICIARALASDPELIIADESVSALDVSIQAQVLDLLMRLQAERGLAYLFITHDMAVVERISHRVAVLYLGQFMEIGPRQAVFEDPRHPYTRKLLAAVPVPDPDRVVDTTLLRGEIPSPVRAVGDEPPMLTYRVVGPDHLVADNF
jgi:glutathione transport system ATP-binding protein